MIYGIFAVLLIAYFELVGRWIAYKLKIRRMQFYFAISFFSILAFTFVFTSVLTSNNCSFYLILVIYGILFLTCLFFAVKDINKLDSRFNKWYILFLLLIVCILTYYSYNTTLGNSSSFDTVYYANFITNNIENTSLNSRDVYLNGQLIEKMTYYNTSTYYYLISCILGVFGKITTLLNVEFFYLSAFVWIFQLIYNFLLADIILESINIFGFKKKLASIVVAFVMIFVFGKFYYNSALGFIGNSLRTLAISYATLYIYSYFNDRNKCHKYLFYSFLLASCSLSTSGMFIMLFYLFGLFFILVETEDNIFKEYTVVFAIPLYALCNMELHQPIIMFGLPIVLIILGVFFDKYILKIIRKYKLTKIILFISIISMFVLSRRFAEGIFDFSSFINNQGAGSDMVPAYFNIYFDMTPNDIYRLITLILVSVGIFTNIRKPLVMCFVILILVLFNPFCCGFVSNVISVYYRAYEIVINPFTIMLFAISISYRVLNKYIYYTTCLIVLIVYTLTIDFVKPNYWHYSFNPLEGEDYIYKNKLDRYDYVNKMGVYEFDIIRELKDRIYFYRENNPYIITGNILTQSNLPIGKYLYGRSLIKNPNWTDDELKLYYIFYPVAYWNEKGPMNQDFDNMKKYIKNAKINYLVVDKNTNYYDPEQKVWYSLMLKVNKECNTYPVYENERFALYHFTY